ncbi:MAG: DNA polymerase III subunit beta, partial [Eubacteriales bacterium]|nr:DNA polymerase III subunit beta [Eubacteriales bacterium]
FIKYKQILPTDHATRVRINRMEMLDSLNRAMLLAREGNNNLVRLNIADEMIKITANNAKGKINEETSAEINGADIEIAFNARYFVDVLKVLDDEYLYMDMSNNVSPCVIRPIQGDAFYYLVLPVRIFTQQ